MNRFAALSLTNFRNYASLQVELTQGPVVLYGRNGSGKTNLLEALSLFALGTGFRGAKLPDFARKEEEAPSPPLPWAVHATLDSGVTLATGLAPEGRGHRLCKIQGEPVRSATAFHPYVRLLPITPAMDHLFTAPSLERRHFVDRLIATYDPEHTVRLVAYDKAMKQRLTLLKREEAPDPIWLSSLERLMARNSLLITQARTALMGRLQQGEAEHGPLFPRFTCRMMGQIEELLAEASEELEGQLCSLLERNREIDRACGMTTLGCHRSDFEVTHQGKDRLARHCSTGEQKILLISILLAFVAQRMDSRRDQEAPDGFLALLLDDVIARLDETHRLALFEQIAFLTRPKEGALPVQTFFTGTDRKPFEDLRRFDLSESQFLEISAGTIRKA